MTCRLTECRESCESRKGRGREGNSQQTCTKAGAEAGAGKEGNSRRNTTSTETNLDSQKIVDRHLLTYDSPIPALILSKLLDRILSLLLASQHS
eukprot:763330-Hanusia_phi.AAC.1